MWYAKGNVKIINGSHRIDPRFNGGHPYPICPICGLVGYRELLVKNIPYNDSFYKRCTNCGEITGAGCITEKEHSGKSNNALPQVLLINNNSEIQLMED